MKVQGGCLWRFYGVNGRGPGVEKECREELEKIGQDGSKSGEKPLTPLGHRSPQNRGDLCSFFSLKRDWPQRVAPT